MTQMNRWGPGVDRVLLSSLMDLDNEALGYELWCSVIRTIASKALERHGKLPVDSEDAQNAIEGLIDEWMDDTLPCSELLLIIGESDYFRDIHSLTWDEQLSYGGKTSVCLSDIMYDLKVRYEHQAENITEEGIESFFAEWQTSFVRRVCEEAKQLVNAVQD